MKTKAAIVLSYLIPLLLPWPYAWSMAGLALLLFALLIVGRIERRAVWREMQKKTEVDLSGFVKFHLSLTAREKTIVSEAEAGAGYGSEKARAILRENQELLRSVAPDLAERFFACSGKVFVLANWLVLTVALAGIMLAAAPPTGAAQGIATAAEEEAPPAAGGFFAARWVKFYGAKDGKRWISHPAVDSVARKILRCRNAAWLKPARKRMFPFSIRFVDAAGQERILFFDTEYGTFDRENLFRHDLTGDEVEKFYSAVAAVFEVPSLLFAPERCIFYEDDGQSPSVR